MPPAQRRIAIVGGGWSGLAAAVEMGSAGHPVTVFEAARQLGGRARSVDWNGLQIDNGQHLMIGAYREVRRLLGLLGTDGLIEQRPLDLRGPDFQIRLPRLPAPLHLAIGLLTTHGLSLGEKLAAVRFMQALKRRGFRLEHDLSASRLLELQHQPARLVDRLWGPICVAALNTPLDQASAQVFCNVLRDSLAGPRADSDLLFKRAAMGRLLPEAAARFIVEQGGTVQLSSKVEGIRRTPDGYHLAGPDVEADQVVLAVHAARLPALLEGLPEMAGVAEQVTSYRWQPILTLWLRFKAPVHFPFPMLALEAGSQSPWAFDRGDLAPGLVSIVVSAEGPHLQEDHAQLTARYVDLLARAIDPLPALSGWKCIVEKRATYACTPGMFRPAQHTPLPGLWLTGDYTRGDYPSTLEGTVRSGVQCAHLLMENL